MFNFEKITIEDRDIMQRYLSTDKAFMSERNFVSLFLWCDHYKVKKCIQDDCLYLCSEYDPEYFTIFPPFTESGFEQAAVKLMTFAVKQGKKVRFNSVSEAQKEKLSAIFPDGAMEFIDNRDAMDYIYKGEDLMHLVGKKFSAKRNHINKFLALYDGMWSYEEMDIPKHSGEIIAFQAKWCEDRGSEPGVDTEETVAIKKALKYFKELGLKGGILRVDGKMAAFTIGKRVTDQLFGTMFEKADTSYEGAYTMINQQFALHNYEGIPFINREEDLGIEGLRKSKLSYNPVQLTKKYIALVDVSKVL